MRGVDTNILVRFFANDHPEQAEAARAVMAAGDVFIATTVLLEFEWVMRSAYKRSADAVLRALAALAGMRGVTVEAPETLARTITLAQHGADFADALHLGGRRRGDARPS